MSDSLSSYNRTMGTLPVFMTAISTILGAILFLRFGYSVANVGLFLTLMIIVLGHLVTIPTAMAVAEIATNQKVEGGGAYYIISRSFGLNIGGSIGLALFLSQAISVAFYVIAFTLACGDLIEWANLWIQNEHPDLPFKLSNEILNYTVMALLTVLMLTKGANVGVKALYIVVVVLFASLAMFFFGTADYTPEKVDFFSRVGAAGNRDNPDSFFTVFTIIFPAFTGIAAGLGLSGDLKDPKKSIPRGTLWATVGGIVVYILVAFKLYFSVPQEALADDQLIMQEIALWGPIIPIGLACAAMSSALGSIMIAPRTLQALGSDSIFPKKVSKYLAAGRSKDNEPVRASLITCLIGFLFVSLQELNVVAEIISMFFMVTYGAICMVSFFEHFAADPAYRPTFRSRWYVSLFGGLLCFYLMFQMNFVYAVASIVLMVIIYLWISYTNRDRKGLENLFKGIIFQITRSLQIVLQKKDDDDTDVKWRPFIISISGDTFNNRAGFDMVRWMAHRYGFGTYIHYVEGLLNSETQKKANDLKVRLLKYAEGVKSRVYLDTMISPSYTSAIAQSVQLPGISGKGNNMILFDFNKENKTHLSDAIKNYNLLKAAQLDICLLRSSSRGFGYRQNIHVWITSTEHANSNHLILLAYIMMGHPDWKEGDISIFTITTEHDRENKEERLHTLIKSGRLPISSRNVQIITQEEGKQYQEVINKYSKDADITLIGFRDQDIREHGEKAFDGYPDVGNILFVNANEQIVIE